MTIAARPEVLAGTALLLAELERAGVRYVHWKSNWHLAASLAGDDDLDLLVRREDAGALAGVLARAGLKPASNRRTGSFPTVHQYVGCDAATLRLTHVDVYYSITTGASLLKEYRLPLEPLLLAGDARLHGVRVPEPAAELLTLVCLQMIKRSSLLQLAGKRSWRSAGPARDEIGELLARDPDAVERALELLPEHLPEVDPELWRACLRALTEGSSVRRRYALGRRVRARLRGYRRVGRVAGAWHRLRLVAAEALGGARRGPRASDGAKCLTTGGSVIALVGPEATGKSTLAADLAGWLGAELEVAQVHLGKPPATPWTVLLAWPLPLLRRWLPGERASVAPTRGRAGAAPTPTERPRLDGEGGMPAPVEVDALPEPADASDDGAAAAPAPRPPSALYALRSLMIAWDRRALALRVHRLAANGAVVVCDRYPSPDVGAMDSARLAPEAARGGWRRRAAALEQALYRSIPRPSLVVRLTVPVEVAVRRNRERVKDGKEDDAYVVHRHTHQEVPSFPGVPLLHLDTGEERDAVTRRLREAVWRHL